MGLVGDDDDVVSLGVALGGVDILVELLDQGEDVGLVLGQQAAQVLAAGGPAGLAVVVHHAAAGEGLVELGVQVLSVGEHQEGEVAAQLAMHLAGEHDHGVALARALGVPEDAQLALPLLCDRGPHLWPCSRPGTGGFWPGSSSARPRTHRRG